MLVLQTCKRKVKNGGATYDGGTTGASSADLYDYYSRFIGPDIHVTQQQTRLAPDTGLAACGRKEPLWDK